MSDWRIGEAEVTFGTCPRIAGASAHEGPDFSCPALESVDEAEGEEEHLARSVEALMGCRAFLWDVLTDGGWTGCARTRLKELTALYGTDRVGDAFDGGEP